MANNFVIGKGTKFSIQMLPDGDRTLPTPASMTLSAGAVAATAGQATLTMTSALGSNVTIAAGNYIGWTNPTTGKVVPVQLKNTASQGQTTVVVNSVPEAIAASSTASVPLRLSGRTAANINRSGNDFTLVTFDSNSFQDGTTTSIEQTIECPGAYLPSDPAGATLEYAFLNLREVYFELELPKPNANYTRGRIYKGVCSITDLPLEVSAESAINLNATLAVRGEPVNVDPA